jgi:hypothetical protein
VRGGRGEEKGDRGGSSLCPRSRVSCAGRVRGSEKSSFPARIRTLQASRSAARNRGLPRDCGESLAPESLRLRVEKLRRVCRRREKVARCFSTQSTNEHPRWNREQGTWNTEHGTGNTEQGTRNTEHGTWDEGRPWLGRGDRRSPLMRWMRKRPGLAAGIAGKEKSFSEEGSHEGLDPGLGSGGPLVALQPSGRVRSRWSCTLPGPFP